MRNTYILISALSIIYLAALLYGFSKIGSPFQARHIKVDESRVRKLQNIKSQIENFFSTNRRLPQYLSDLNITNQTSIKDDVTNEFYDYHQVNAYRYQLCATFDSSNLEKDQKKQVSSYYPSTYQSFLHPKGYYCFDLEIPEYLKTQRSFPAIPPIQPFPTPTLYPRMINLSPPAKRVYTSACGKYKTLEECNSASLEGAKCSWYACKNVCLTMGTDSFGVCNTTTLSSIYNDYDSFVRYLPT